MPSAPLVVANAARDMGGSGTTPRTDRNTAKGLLNSAAEEIGKMSALVKDRLLERTKSRKALPEKNAATGKVSLAGRMVNEQQDRFKEGAGLTKAKWVLLMLKRALTMSWLFLADDETQTKNDIINLMQYLAFLSAFLTAICTEYLLGIPDMNWDHIEEMWGNGNSTTFDLGQKGNPSAMSGEDIARLHRDALQILAFGATLCFLLTMVHTVITMAMIQQTTGDVEAMRFKQKAEAPFVMGLLLFTIGIVFFAGQILYHYFIFSSSLNAVIIGYALVLLLITLYFVGVFWFQQVAIYEVKAESYHNSPMALSAKECDALTLEFISQTGVELVSGPRLEEFVKQKFTTGRALGKRDTPCVLSEGTSLILHKMADLALEEYVEHFMKQSKLKATLTKSLQLDA